MRDAWLPVVALSVAALAVALDGCGRPWTSAPTEMTWELVGAHLEVSCEGCHGAVLGPLPTECAACHEDDRPAGHFVGSLSGPGGPVSLDSTTPLVSRTWYCCPPMC